MNIGLYGDSTQVGVSVYGGIVYPEQWPVSRLLQCMLDAEFGAGAHAVSNYGVGGSTISGALCDGIYPGSKTFAQHMDEHCDDLIVCNWGINDAYKPGYTATMHKGYYADLKSVVEGAGKAFIYEAPNPLNSSGHDAILTTNNSAVKSISGIAVIEVNSAIKGYYPNWSAHLSDGIHPNAIMYGYIAMVIFNGLVPHLTALTLQGE